ncbi:MAG: hypothetical protein E7255_08430 [Lachnospiraceae bacterium]|nr:hypothetical protein [Lachnospiraceae bacterium]
MDRLETITIDIPNKKFEINHTPISKNCSKLVITFENGIWSVSGTEEFYVSGKGLGNKFSDEVSNFN